MTIEQEWDTARAGEALLWMEEVDVYLAREKWEKEKGKEG